MTAVELSGLLQYFRTVNMWHGKKVPESLFLKHHVNNGVYNNNTQHSIEGHAIIRTQFADMQLLL
jgi:tellurite resistance-related uncharacterized protein